MGMEPAGGWASVDGHGPAGSILTRLYTRASSRLYVPVLQSRLDRFRDAWNSHRLRSESNRSPTQIWRDGMLASQGSGHTATDPDLERRHASEPGLWTHSHRPRSGETACWRARALDTQPPTQIWRDGMLASQGSGHTATDPDLERRHAGEPGLWTHSHRPRSGETAC